MIRALFHMLTGHLDIFFREIAIQTLARVFVIGRTISSKNLMLELVTGINNGEGSFTLLGLAAPTLFPSRVSRITFNNAVRSSALNLTGSALSCLLAKS